MLVASPWLDKFSVRISRIRPCDLGSCIWMRRKRPISSEHENFSMNKNTASSLRAGASPQRSLCGCRKARLLTIGPRWRALHPSVARESSRPSTPSPAHRHKGLNNVRFLSPSLSLSLFGSFVSGKYHDQHPTPSLAAPLTLPKPRTRGQQHQPVSFRSCQPMQVRLTEGRKHKNALTDTDIRMRRERQKERQTEGRKERKKQRQREKALGFARATSE